ncbi:GNAT family N-acetyltransferase [Levilinea saccharolytica]|uniref:N-acetyltransferase domain-containing protein n=1 Tax=Levilinea saccharolytica TaxID=229921 RepID=A0A0P6XM95_9CHLR|nr:GNAT family N-acetyltransferase [Levilinea saccharolytica]KPL77483.1 hypothetical protein ADN01_16515 [Levilinea saccharolytica]GAP18863.1 acetyltransferase, including N-acetylase of ribosomal proteins [Levilinea saccharolytica]
MELVSARLRLREFRPADLDALAAYANPPEMRLYEQGMPDREAAYNFLERVIRTAGETPRMHVYLAVTVPPEDTVIGHVSLNSQNPDIREWEIGWAIRHEDWGKGYASEAARRMLAYAFHDLQAHRVVAFCHAENTASARVMENIGMKQEGYLRQTRWFNDGWADERVYAILESDFFSK